MTEDLLRRWVRRELPLPERRAVSRWVVECADPSLPPLLAGMLQEQRDEVADRALADRSSVWQSLVDAWHRLLEAGRAELSSGGGALVLASVGRAVAGELTLQEQDSEVEAVFRPRASSMSAALFVTDDDGVARRLLGPETAAELRARLVGGPRVTVWGVYGPALGLTTDAASDLARLVTESENVVVAVRYRPAQ